MAVTIYEALALIEKNLPSLATETIPIEDAVGRVASCSRSATIALPAFDNSAMDGYGLKGEGSTYTIIGKMLAGDSHDYRLGEGECIKILTGARVPESVGRIIPQELVSAEADRIRIDKLPPEGANIRRRGEDIEAGEVILHAGEVIDSAHIALLASQGITHTEVYRRVRVGLFASGSELKLHFEQLDTAQIYNSNTLYLLSRAQELGAQTRFVGKSEDSVASLRALVEAALDCDLIVTSGGVSVGEADYTKAAFASVGMETLFEKVRIKPGKPTTFGRIGRTLVLNLPGNPLACALNFELFGKYLIHALGGRRAAHHAVIQTPLQGDALTTPRPVATVVPGVFDGSGFRPAEKYAPGMVSVLGSCNGMIVVDAQCERIEAGEIVKFLPMRWDFTREDFEDFMS